MTPSISLTLTLLILILASVAEAHYKVADIKPITNISCLFSFDNYRKHIYINPIYDECQKYTVGQTICFNYNSTAPVECDDNSYDPTILFIVVIILFSPFIVIFMWYCIRGCIVDCILPWVLVPVSLPVSMVSNLVSIPDSGIKDYDCSICMSSLSYREAVQLSCEHQYHKSCIISWLKYNSICPLCRSVVNRDSDMV